VVGTGPFTIKSHDPAGMDTVLVRRKGYDWAPSTEAHQGEAYLDSINFETIVDAGVRTGDLQTGTIDMDTAPLTISSYLNNPAYGIVGRIYPGMNQSFLPNLSHPITAELAVRQAISLAIDRNAIVSGLLTKYDKVATSVIASNTPYYQPLTGIQYDPAKAKALLQNAGWVPGPGGIRVKNGSNLTLVLAYTGNGRQSGPIVQLVQEELRTVGINLQIKLMTPAQSAETQASGDFDIWFTPSFRAEPDIVRERIAFSGDNLGKAPAPRPVDSLLVQQESEENTQQRQQTITEALQELVDQADVIPLYESAGLYVYNSRLHGVDTDANSLLTLYDTWVSRS
jgi:peptide/nickel transport system substrate-binding protein